jgi:UDP-N-acetylmuramoylalanine--D-glutamate ligase
VATILNISEDHMDRYADLSEYHRSKQRIYFGAKTVVVNREDPLTNPPLAENVRCITFGLNRPDRFGFGLIERNQERQLAFEFKALIETKKISLRGEHNLANCLAALALGFAIELPMDSMLQTLIDFEGLPHRCQLVATIKNVEYINDSKATNVGAALAALKGFAEKEKNIILIAGGEGKEADFSPLKNVIFDSVRAVILIGRDAQLIANVLDGFEGIHYSETLDDAVTIAKDIALPGNTVLLSPACASFDMFTGYEDRGEKFIQAVEKVAA